MSNPGVPHLHAWLWRFVEVAVVATALCVLAVSPAVNLPTGVHVDPLCAAAIRQGPPTMIFESPAAAHEPFARTTSWVPSPLPESGSILRVAGYLRLAFEGSALYRAPVERALTDADSYRLDLYAMWPGEPFWHTRAAVASERCAVVEGSLVPHVGWRQHLLIRVRRVAVWDWQRSRLRQR